MDNTSRGILAEFLIAAALGSTQRSQGIEWEECDLCIMKSGTTDRGQKLRIRSIMETDSDPLSSSLESPLTKVGIPRNRQQYRDRH